MADIEKLNDPCVSAVKEEEEGEASEEERFDYTDSEDHEEDKSMLTVPASPRRIKPWSFMDTFNPKKQALAIAREIDAKRGIKLELPAKQPQTSVSETGTTEESSTQSTIRRVPSGAKAPPTGHNIRASTPVESDLENGRSHNAHDSSIGDVAGQSTPLTLAKITNGGSSETRNEVIGVSNGSSRPLEDELLNGLRRETKLLKEEISKLKAQVLEQSSIQAGRDNELATITKALEERDKEVQFLKNAKQLNESSSHEQIDELKRLLQASEEDRLQAEKTNGNIISNLRDEIKRKDGIIDETRKRTSEIEERSDKRREKLEKTIDELKDKMSSEREDTFKELRAVTAEWQRRLDDKETKFSKMKEEYESDYRSKLSKIQEELANKGDDLRDIQRELNHKCKELDEARGLKDDLQTKHEKFEATKKEEIQTLESHITQLEADLLNLHELQKTLKSENGEYRRKLQSTEKRSEELTRELQLSKSSRNELHSELTALSKKLEVATTNNEKLQKSQELLKSSENELRKKISILNEKIKSDTDKNNQLQSDLQTLKQETENLKKQSKEKLDNASHANKQLKDELQSLTQKRDKLETERKEAEAKLKETLDLQNELATLSSTYLSLQKSLHEEQQAHEITTKNARKVEEYSNALTKFIENLTLFDVQIGSIMMHTFNKDHNVGCLDPFLVARNKDITGFHMKGYDQKHQILEKRIDLLNLKNQELTSQIENQWKVQVESQKREISQQKQALDDIGENCKEVEKKCKELELRFEKSQDEKAAMLKQKEELIQEKVTLNDQISVLKSSTVVDEQRRITELIKQIEEVSTNISAIREQIKFDSTENNRLKVTIENQQKQLTKLKSKCEEQEVALDTQKGLETLLASRSEDLVNLQDVCYKQRVELEEKARRLQNLEGKNSRRITFEIARQSRPDITRDLYDRLMIAKVDLIDMVELQNIVKNLILLLEIPFNKLTKKGPLVAIYLKYERPIFLHFANRLHIDLFNEAIDIKRFTNEAFDQYTDSHNMAAIKHPLEACLENLYQRLITRL